MNHIFEGNESWCFSKEQIFQEMLSNVLESRLIKNCYNESHFSVSYGFVPICCESQFACPGQFRSNLLWVFFACLGQFCTNLLWKSICLSWPILFQFVVRVNLPALTSFVPICCESQFACPGQFCSNLLWESICLPCPVS